MRSASILSPFKQTGKLPQRCCFSAKDEKHLTIAHRNLEFRSLSHAGPLPSVLRTHDAAVRVLRHDDETGSQSPQPLDGARACEILSAAVRNTPVLGTPGFPRWLVTEVQRFPTSWRPKPGLGTRSVARISNPSVHKSGRLARIGNPCCVLTQLKSTTSSTLRGAGPSHDFLVISSWINFERRLRAWSHARRSSSRP